MTIAIATPRTRIITTVSSVLNPKLNQSLTCTNLTTQPISHSTENWSSKSVQLSFFRITIPKLSCWLFVDIKCHLKDGYQTEKRFLFPPSPRWWVHQRSPPFSSPVQHKTPKHLNTLWNSTTKPPSPIKIFLLGGFVGFIKRCTSKNVNRMNIFTLLNTLWSLSKGFSGKMTDSPQMA